MKHNRTPGLIWLMLMHIAICGTATVGEKRPQGIVLKEVLSIGTLEDDLLYMWAGITTDEQGGIYVTDAMDYSIKKFGSSGQLLKKVGRRGQGPGEFLAPRLLASSSGLIYATDQSIMGIQVFDESLAYKYKIPFKWPISDFKVLPDGRIAVISYSMARGSELSILNQLGMVLAQLDYGNKKNTLLLNNADLDIDEDDNIYIAYSFQDRIDKWALSGEKIWTQKLLGIKKLEEQRVGRFVVPTKVTFKNVVLDEQGYLLVLGGHLAKNPSRDVFVLSCGGEYIATFTLPEPSHCIHMDKQGFLYARANEGVTLKKFKLRYLYD